ncbi:MAG: exonuclease domain-containing protein [Clostridium sp.]|nr:exonuclease domain-containing protein [Clostridium sp.]
MRYVVVDLEMNKLDNQYTEEKKICNQEIIEIGAVMLDNGHQEISRFKTYVKPQYSEKIRDVITKLTGITTKMVKDAPVFEEAVKQFFGWCFSYDGECQVQAWSDSDLHQILAEIALKHYVINKKEQELIDNWMDFQNEYIVKLGLGRVVSLEKALNYAGIEFRGKQHDALDDAKNTADLFKIIRDSSLFEEHLHIVKEALESKPMVNTLGSMFDFAKIARVIA